MIVQHMQFHVTVSDALSGHVIRKREHVIFINLLVHKLDNIGLHNRHAVHGNGLTVEIGRVGRQRGHKRIQMFCLG